MKYDNQRTIQMKAYKALQKVDALTEHVNIKYFFV